MHGFPPATRRYNLFLHIQSVDLRNGWPLGLGLGDPSEYCVALLGIREALAVEDLKRSILLDEAHDEDRIVGKLALVADAECGCELHCGRALSFETKRTFCKETNEDNNLPRRLNHIVISDLVSQSVSLQAIYMVLDSTHIQFVYQGQTHSPPLDVFPFRLIGHVRGTGE